MSRVCSTSWLLLNTKCAAAWGSVMTWKPIGYHVGCGCSELLQRAQVCDLLRQVSLLMGWVRISDRPNSQRQYSGIWMAKPPQLNAYATAWYNRSLEWLGTTQLDFRMKEGWPTIKRNAVLYWMLKFWLHCVSSLNLANSSNATNH